jgi:F0F1-type ATP synthase epsilon subunit
MPELLQFVIQTPRQVLFAAPLRAARVPTHSGQVGLRPGEEPIALVVEPGLLMLRGESGVRYAASAGGLLETERTRAVFYTPFAVLGDDGTQVLAELERALAAPDSDLSARRRLSELEQRIVHELRRPTAGTRSERSAT